MTTARDELGRKPMLPNTTEGATPLAFGSTAELGRTAPRAVVICTGPAAAAVVAMARVLTAAFDAEDERRRNDAMQLERCSSGPLRAEELQAWCHTAPLREPLQHGPQRKGRGGKPRRW